MEGTSCEAPHCIKLAFVGSEGHVEEEILSNMVYVLYGRVHETEKVRDLKCDACCDCAIPSH